MQPVDIIINGLIYCGLITAAILTISRNPRVMLHSYPKEIQASVPPKTDVEKKQTFIYALPILLVIVLYPLLSIWHTCAMQHLAYKEILLYTWALTFMFNVYDLLVLDWLLFCTITPKFMVIKGTEGNRGYKNYRFHFMGFLKGIVITGILALLISGVAYLLCRQGLFSAAAAALAPLVFTTIKYCIIL